MSAESTSTATAPLTRRERQRQATFDEIVVVARRLLAESRTVSLRAVATEMGMTPPALYRYVDGYDELILLVAKAIFADVVETMRATVAKYDADDPGAQMVSAATAFRQWALAHPDEFEILFASRETAGYKGRAAQEGGFEFASMFSEIFLRVYERYHFDLSEADEQPAELIAGLEQARDAGALPCEFPGEPIGLVWVFMRCWARVYGTVTLEVFGHIDQPMIDSGAMFAAMMDDNGRELNLGEDFERLRALIRSELSIRPSS